MARNRLKGADGLSRLGRLGAASNRTWLVGALALAVVGWLVFALLRPSPVARQLTIATSSAGGTYSILGTRLAQLLNTLPAMAGREARAEITGGSVQNVDLLESGEVDLGLATQTTLLGVSPARREGLRVLADLYEDVVQLVVRSDAAISQLSDLAGKDVFIGSDGSGMSAIAREVLGGVGVEVSEQMRAGTQEIGVGAATRLLADGALDAAFVLAGIPTDAVSEAMTSGCCELLDLSNELAELAQDELFASKYNDDVVPASIYGQPEDVHTISTTAHLVSRNDFPEDLAFEIVDTLYDNIHELFAAHPAPKASSTIRRGWTLSTSTLV